MTYNGKCNKNENKTIVKNILSTQESFENHTTDAPLTNIGIRLRHARLIKKLSLKKLSIVVGCSEGFLSKVENDKVKPSLTTLHRIVSALGTNITTLFAGAESQEEVIISRQVYRNANESELTRIGMGVTLEALLPLAKGMLLQAGIHNIQPGGKSAGMISHEGEEVGYILEGELNLVVEDVEYKLVAGDSFFFKSNLQHGYSNPGMKNCTRVLWINTPPTF